jgi:hypothetical protein
MGSLVWRTTSLVLATIIALVVVLVTAIDGLVPGWRSAPLIVIGALVALETAIVHGIARGERLDRGEVLRYLVPELFILAIVVRASGLWGVTDAERDQRLSGWISDPASMVDGLFIGQYGFAVAVAIWAQLTLRDIAAVLPRPGEIEALHDDGHRAFAAVRATERDAAVGALGRRMAYGGLLVMLSLTAARLRPAGTMPGADPAATLGFAAVAYVVAGVLVYSQARLLALQTRWRQDGARIADDVAARWTWSSLWLTLGSVVVAGMLPRSYGGGILDALRIALGWVGYVLAMIGYVLLWIVSMLVSIPAWLLALLAPGGDAPVMAEQPPPPPPPPLDDAVYAPQLWPALVFWACVALLLAHAVRTVAQRHPALLARINLRNWLQVLHRWLRGGWSATTRWLALSAERLAPPTANDVAALHRPRRQSAGLPRERIRGLYLAALEYTAQRGMLRRPAQTPTEYAATIGDAQPSARLSLSALTESFIIARYSRRPLGINDVRRALGHWLQVRRALRRGGGASSADRGSP